jgi:hypothetical protein
MPISINCNNKGCGKYQEPLIDPKTGDVYCSNCDQIIQGISHFTKVQLKTLGQVRRPLKGAFAIKCNKCKIEALPKLIDDTLVCSGCNTPSNISKPFEILVRKAIKEGNKDL